MVGLLRDVVGVEFDNWNGGHNLNGLSSKEDNGYWCHPHSIALAPFTKSDIEPGMFVVCRNGKSGVVMPMADGKMAIMSQNGRALTFLRDYDDELIESKYELPEYDIMEVWGKSDRMLPNEFFSTHKRPLLYKRDNRAKREKLEELERTIEQAQKQIKELKKEA